MTKKIMRGIKNIRACLILGVIVLLVTSCGKEMFYTADDYVGIYNVSIIAHNRIGVESYIDSGTGRIGIYKVSNSRIEVTGYIDTFGEVKGNKVYFEPTSYSDGQMKVQMTFGQGILNGNILTFTSVMSGYIYNNGKSYPLTSEIEWTAIREE